ncbi:MAG TPA: 30S ribosomal protein THX [Burkholderiales bacterium]|nr:30S ribosomal protein THX [Burkholderiales bacterium]
MTGVIRAGPVVYNAAVVFFESGIETMGKGDLRTRRGKLFRGSYGKTRPRRPKKKPPVAAKPGK